MSRWAHVYAPAGFYVGLWLLIPSLMWTGLTGYWFYDRLYGNQSEILDPRANKSVFHVGDILVMEYDVVRYKDCELRLTRVFQRPDGREVQLQYVIQIITGDAVPHKRRQGYQVEVPQGVLGPGELKVTGKVLTRIQYFCNGLDYMVPRTKDMPAVEITVYDKREITP